MRALDLSFMISRPIAHRGLHGLKPQTPENSIAAARAAIGASYAIECDVQRSADGVAFVFHDDTLERMTEATGRFADHRAANLTGLPLRGGAEPIPRFDDFLAAISGKTPLVVEIKSFFDGDVRVAQSVAASLARYGGPVVIESFDPDIIAFLRTHGAALGVGHIALGIVGEARYDAAEWPDLTKAQRRDMTHFLHYTRTRPDFLSWNVDDLPHAIPTLLREGLNIPITTWTVRSEQQAAFARQYADQVVFEGFLP